MNILFLKIKNKSNHICIGATGEYLPLNSEMRPRNMHMVQFEHHSRQTSSRRTYPDADYCDQCYGHTHHAMRHESRMYIDYVSPTVTKRNAQSSALKLWRGNCSRFANAASKVENGRLLG